MAPTSEKILILGGEEGSRQALQELLTANGYGVFFAASGSEGMEYLRSASASVVLLHADPAAMDWPQTLAEIKGSVATSSARVILLTSPDPTARARGLDLGADDALSAPAPSEELLARIRAQFRARRAFEALQDKMRIAEEGQEIAHTAFQALAVTEKMTRDAFSLDRRLKIGLTALFVVATVIVGIFFLYRNRAEKEARRAYAVIAQLERGVSSQQSLVEQVRRMRLELQQSSPVGSLEQMQQLEQQSAELRAKIASRQSGDVASLKQQLAVTSGRLRRLEASSKVAPEIIRSSATSVCLLHVVVGFREKATGQRLRYAGINREGEPLQDSDGNPIFTTTGRGPEVRADFFGTGFLAASGGRILTNRHVVEPWWKNEELDAVSRQGIDAVISEINAFFPDSPRAYRVEIQKISPENDLALVQGDLGDLKRSALPLDTSGQAAVRGDPLVSIGYATGLVAIMARAGEETVREIVAVSNGTPKLVMAELARRNLIRPLTTQGHIGDILPDKIVYDAQTATGGSGGPLFSLDGKVIGVTFAVVKGFGGSNFGIPIRLAQPLLQ
ncbi:MAG: trypsin-like peptidase domain-containing protein [Verrucomicrobiales bacterium]|nr:trypsin-like peptidase domain-containing protein [Verrucomicrobiales bacterium]